MSLQKIDRVVSATLLAASLFCTALLIGFLLGVLLFAHPAHAVEPKMQLQTMRLRPPPVLCAPLLARPFWMQRNVYVDEQAPVDAARPFGVHCTLPPHTLHGAPLMECDKDDKGVVACFYMVTFTDPFGLDWAGHVLVTRASCHAPFMMHAIVMIPVDGQLNGHAIPGEPT